MSRPKKSRQHGPSLRNAPRREVTGHDWNLLSLWPLMLLGLILAFQPIRSDDVWWELSRGREVLRGTLSPSRHLLSLDNQREADWLGGVPWFAAYSGFGATGLMLVRLIGVALSVWLLGTRLRVSYSLTGLLLSMFLLLCLDSSFDPGPALWDGLFVVAVAICTAWRARQGTIASLLALGLCFLAGANLAPRVVWGFPVLLSSLWFGTKNSPNRFRSRMILPLGVALVACCITPRGIATLWDSWRQVAPLLVVDQWTLLKSPWVPVWQATWDAKLLAIIVLPICCLWTLRQLTDGFWLLVSVWLGSLFAVTFSVANIPLAAIWLVSSWFSKEGSTVHSHPAPRTSHDWFRRHAAPVAIFVAALWLLGWPGSRLSQSGWGIESRLDYRYLQLALQEAKPKGTAWAADTRSAGMLAWLSPGTIQVQDIPHRALLGSRWREYVELEDDLRTGRKMSYWREDGSPGGWWLPLEARQTTLLLFPAEEFQLIRELEPTLWKPLTLDSPVLGYASTADSQYVQPLIQVLQQRRFADLGSWTYSPPRSTGSPFDRDRWGWRTELSDSSTILRQARVFRAMGQRTAAMRVLRHMLQTASTRETRAEVAACQAELAHLEFVAAGRASRFRELAAQYSLEMSEREPNASADSKWPVSLEAYLSGNWGVALDSLPTDDLESEYARVSILMEAGDTAAAIAVLQNTDWSSDTRLQLLARLLQDDLLQATNHP